MYYCYISTRALTWYVIKYNLLIRCHRIRPPPVSLLFRHIEMKEHVSFDGKTIGYEQIRKLSGIDTLLTVVIVFSIKTYMVVLEKYRPAEIQNFRIKYIDEWRKRFLSIKGVKYKEIPHFLNF